MMTVFSDMNGACLFLGATLNRYIDGQADFAELETELAEAMRSLPDVQDLFKQLYHVVNHYELDADLRAEDPHYATVMNGKLREVVRSLGTGNVANVNQSLKAFWLRSRERSLG